MNDLVFAYAEELFGQGYIIATYYLQTDPGIDIVARAASFAVGQSVGTWVPVPGITREMLERHMGRIVAIYDIPPVELETDLPAEHRAFLIQIAFPEANFGPQFPMLFTTLLGNDVSTATQLKLVDLALSPSFVAGFGGPKFGIAGLREHLGIPERPILLNMIKPCTGFGPEVGARFFAESARGGVDIIKDDELLGSTSFSAMLDRVTAYRRAAQQVYEETGHRAAYCPNITDRPEKVVENARRAREMGADMVMVNAVTAGLGVVQAVAEDPACELPILSHYAGTGSMTENPRAGISSPLLLGKLCRLAGADTAMFGSIYSRYPLLREKYLRIAHFHRMPLFDLNPTLPCVGGGIHPANARRIIADIGPDVMLAVGGAIQGHPGGAAAGARAMRQAIDAAVAGLPLAEMAQQHPELQQALEVWGD
ncbi:MAG: RuBisCO large subunit C-terminal-like domain-containing protein [Anaerolineae bacterium]|nr:RuBisCO large subunit C-terminal-like domain-containing protein [Anaerolineae bacterium]